VQAKRSLQYELFWEQEPAFKELIDRAWRGLGLFPDMGAMNYGLSKIMKNMQAWGGAKFGNVTRELSRLREKLLQLQTNDALREEVCVVSDQMYELLYRENMLWLQRSRIEWLREVTVIPSFGGLAK
jgi:hypothetical protein